MPVEQTMKDWYHSHPPACCAKNLMIVRAVTFDNVDKSAAETLRKIGRISGG